MTIREDQPGPLTSNARNAGGDIQTKDLPATNLDNDAEPTTEIAAAADRPAPQAD